MKQIVKVFLVVFLFASIAFFGKWGVSKVLAEACQDKTDLSERINCYQNEIAKLSSQSKTLSNQIAQFDAQIRLATLKISQTEEQITLLGGRIDRLEGSLDALTQAYSSRTVETYKMIRVGDPILILISAPDLNEAVARFNYLKKIQESDRDLLNRLQTAQTSYQGQKTDQEKLQAQLTTQKANLDSQKKAKNQLLTQTTNDEKKYQQLLAQAYAEKAAVDAALIAGTKVGPVKKGDPIALVGNTGYPSCSTGKHLHFEVRKGGTWTDPSQYVNSHQVVNCQDYTCGTGISPNYVTLGSGSWDWPISDPIYLTQFYGHTPFSWRYAYSGQIHTGYDLVPKSSDVIRAPADGDLFRSAELCGSSVINIAYIEHGNDVISLYLHVQ
jgi:septal ring factor EnvC (AmiA/AmiB activator)